MVRNNLNVFCIQLVAEPSGQKTQEVVVGKVKAEKAGVIYVGWIGGYTQTQKTKNVSVYDHNWRRIGQFSPNKIELLQRSTRLCVTA